MPERLGNLENREAEPKHNEVIVDFLRHGSTQYLENSLSTDEKNALEARPRDLTEEGEIEVRRTVEEIVQRINPETDVVVLWSSPAWRAQGSEDVLIELLRQKNIEVYKDSAISSMRNFDQHDLEYMSEIWKSLAPINKSAELMYARDPEFQVPNDKFESQPEVKKRAERVFNWIRYLAEHIKLEPGKKLRIIGVSHFEFLNPIIEDIFGPKVETGQGIGKGEAVSFAFDYDPSSKQMKISADFRGEHKEDISFDKNTRNFRSNS